LIPRSDFKVEDDWYVMGLEGTGSKQVVVEDAFIPEHRIVPFDQLTLGTSPGALLYPDNPYYKAPMTIVLNTMLQGPTIGMARGLLDIFEERVTTRMDGHTGQLAFHRPGVQLRFAESAAEVDVAIMLLRQITQDLAAQGRTGASMELAERARLRRNVAYSIKQCMQAADRLLEYGDASGMYSHQELQRWGRSIHMACLQFVLTWDEPALAYSRVRWGLEPESFTT
jgi:alkylation response protein AidB-like acyl-CoA dehydrogenase